MIIENFELDKRLKGCEKIEEEIEGMIFSHKRLQITDQLSLILFDSGQATLEYRKNEIETFMWRDADECERIFSDIDNVTISDLFTFMYDRRWKSIYERD